MSLERLSRHIVLFFTHSGALKYRRLLSRKGIENEMMPVPRKLSSSCGVCISFYCDDISDMITEDVEKIFRENSPSNYEEIYVSN